MTLHDRAGRACIAGLTLCSCVACQTNPAIPTVGHDARGQDAGGVGGGKNGPDGSAWIGDAAPVGPWQPLSDMPACTHASVQVDCPAGWCRIPSGCFVMGSPATLWQRSPNLEDPLTVVFDQPFEIMQNEVTLADWQALGMPEMVRRPLDANEPRCSDPNCAAPSVSWLAALEYANRLSSAHTPPLPHCYDLQGCNGQLGTLSFSCASVTIAASTIYECTGYRLPTEAEWEYAARAGTQTAFYDGDVAPFDDTRDSCGPPQPYLIPVAWYCYNSERRAHAVGQKEPNGFGLYDMLGNLSEWVNDTGGAALPKGPVHNLGAKFDPDTSHMRGTRGGFFLSSPPMCAASVRVTDLTTSHNIGLGARLVRTLP